MLFSLLGVFSDSANGEQMECAFRVLIASVWDAQYFKEKYLSLNVAK